jgi:hypothetical protein
MTDNTDLIAELREQVDRHQGYSWNAAKDVMRRAADALAARDAACGHLENQLVVGGLIWAATFGQDDRLTDDQWAALRAATFEITE